MRPIFRALLLACGLIGLGASGEPHQTAELVLRSGAVYTVDASRSWAQALAVGGGRILYVGTDGGATSWIGPKTRVVELRGRMVLPSFHDAHVHPVTSGIEVGDCDLGGLKTQEQVSDAIRVCAAAHRGESWVRGGGWELPVFPDASPDKRLLDRLVPDRPAYLSAADGHSAWVNSKALALAGVTKETADPPHGRIERDQATGEPSGTLREEAASLIARHLPARTAEEHERGLLRGLEMANRFGLTALHEASASEEALQAYAALERRSRLTARVVASVRVDPGKGLAEVARLGSLRRRYTAGHLRVAAAKIFVDGVLETSTAAVLEPYVGTSGDRGKANLEPPELTRLVAGLDRAGFQIQVHAIGDRAIRMALDAFEAARTANGRRDARHHVAHLELIDPEDIPRFRRLVVIANFQPFWANGDSYLTELTEPKLGPARSRWLYPIASVVRSGASFAFGSDWNVSSMNPLDGIQVAVTRREPDRDAGPAWIGEEAISLSEAIAGYTIGGAYLGFAEKETGSLEPGKSADLIVLDRNLFEIPAWQIHQARVLWTLLEGREVYRDPAFGD
jgi:hypothetical protein